MKNYILIFILLVINISCFSQKKELKNVILGSKSAYTFTNISISTDKQSNKYVYGIFLNEFKLANYSVQTQMHDAFYLTKLNATDSVEWLIKIAETRYNKIESFSSIATSNSYYISLMFVDTIVVNNTSYISKGGQDILLIKIKSDGQFEYINHIGSTKSEGFSEKSLAVDDNDNVYFVGTLGTQNNMSNELVFGLDTIKTNITCAFIVKMDPNGNYLWAKTKVNSNGHLFAFYNIYCYQNSLYALGYAYVNNFQIDSVHISIPIDFLKKDFLIKLDTSGTAQWARYFGVKDFGSFIPRDNFAADGKVYFTGNAFVSNHNDFYFQGGGTSPAASGFNPGGQWDYFIASYDTSGNFRWAKASQSYGDEVITQLGVDTNKNLLVTGLFDYTFALGTDTLYSHGGDDAFVSSLDSNGNYLWSTSVGGSGDELGNGIVTTADGEIYVVGGTASNICYFGQDTVKVDSLPSMFLAKIVNANPVCIGQLSVSNEQWEVFPNPASDEIVVRCKLQGVSNTSMYLYNVLGQQVYSSINFKSTTDNKINVSKYPEGIYFLQLKQNGKTSTKKINIIH